MRSSTRSSRPAPRPASRAASSGARSTSTRASCSARHQNDPPMTSVSVSTTGRERQRSLVDRVLAAFPALVIALVIFVFYAVEAWSRKTPWIFTDELEWTQISRSIASTGHAARRGDPIYFKSLYAYLIAPAWWIHSTSAAYSAIKYLNAFVMRARRRAHLPAGAAARHATRRAIAAAAARRRDRRRCRTRPRSGPRVDGVPAAFAYCSRGSSVRALRTGGRRDVDRWPPRSCSARCFVGRIEFDDALRWLFADRCGSGLWVAPGTARPRLAPQLDAGRQARRDRRSALGVASARSTASSSQHIQELAGPGDSTSRTG